MRHREVIAPYEIATDWVATVVEMAVGDFGGLSDRRMYAPRVGEPLSPKARYDHIGALRRFYRDLPEAPHHLRLSFAPERAFRAPPSLLRLIAPDPRVVDTRAWAKLVHAALNLTQEDLARGLNGVPVYPLALVRAVAAVWCFAGLRADEIQRLAVDCIRWQHEDVTVPETGEALPKGTICFLTVPVNKTSRSFPKAVNRLVGTRIADWERERPANQPRLVDRKTGQLVDYPALQQSVASSAAISCHAPPPTGASTPTTHPSSTATFKLVPSLTKVSNPHLQELTIDAAAGMGVVKHCCSGGGWNIKFTFKVPQSLTPGTNAQVKVGIEITNVKPRQPLVMQIVVLAPDFAQAYSIDYPNPPSGTKTFQIPISASSNGAKQLTIQIGFYSATVTYIYRP